MQSHELPCGKVRLEFRFVPSGFARGMGQLYVNGEKIDEVHMPAVHFGAFSLSETFDVGRDTGTPVSPLYEGDFPFTGKLDKVMVRLLRAGKKKDK
jgi:arylsulfatase